MKTVIRNAGLCVMAAAFAASGAQAQQRVAIGEHAQSRMTYTTAAGVNLARTNSYSGVGTVYSFRAGGGGGICTGSLLNSTTVLTAAHCLTGTGDNAVTGVSFFLPSVGNVFAGEPAARFNASSFAINPLYATNGGLTSGYDVAIVKLRTAATGYETYSLNAGDPLGAFIQVGTGTTGGPDGTNRDTSDYRKRLGTNLHEYYGDEVFSDVGPGVVLGDFDDGLLEHDVFGRNGGFVQLGIPGESNSSPGDSGGPQFRGGRIISVTSFGVTGGIFDGYCGGDSTDPFNSSRGTTVSSLGNCTNSSVGEMFGNTLVRNNKRFLFDQLGYNAFVPEPSTWAMLILGFGAIGGAMRRRKTTLAYA